MRTKLTERRAASLNPKDRAYQCHDTEIRGFFLRIEPTGTRSWFLDYRNSKGRRRRYRIGAYPAVTADIARALAKAAAGKVANGEDVQSEKTEAAKEAARQRSQTLGAFLERHYRAYALSHLKSGAFQLARLEADFSSCLAKPMPSINRWWAESWRRDRLREGLKATTINRRIQRLHAVLSRATAMGLLDSHPLAGLKPLKTDRRGRVRFLSPDEERRLRKALLRREEDLRAARRRHIEWREKRGLTGIPSHLGAFADRLRPIVLLALNTGLRRGEMLGLRWGDVDLKQKAVCVRGEGAKNGQTRWVPLNTEAHSVLELWSQQQIDQAGVLVFPAPDGQKTHRVDKAWRVIMDRAGIQDFRFHDLRHHFASRLAQSGVDLNVIRELLGHSDLAMVLRYAHLNPNRLAWAVEQVQLADCGRVVGFQRG